MFKKLFLFMDNYITSLLSEKTLNDLQQKLIDAGIFIKVSQLFSIILIFMILTFVMLLFIFLLFMISPLILLIVLIEPLSLIVYINYKNEKRIDEIEEELPDYLRQLSSLLKIGLGLETSLNELSKSINSPLNNEIKRALLEISFGKSFDEALRDIAKKNNSENLKHTFEIIIQSKESGGELASILEEIAEDLKDTIMLKKERKSNVMMSVMFLIISSVIATPFALAMIRLYSEFIEQMGRTNPLSSVIPIVSVSYVTIQSILVSVLIGIVLYSSSRKGLRFILIIVPASLSVYYISNLILRGLLGV